MDGPGNTIESSRIAENLLGHLLATVIDVLATLNAGTWLRVKI
jgi:hypothetical protein